MTEETIRRDLDKLEKEGKLLRSHGGAVSIKETLAETPYTIREVTNMREKQAIAVEAVKHILPMDTIALDASSTAWYMAKLLPDIPVTVLTNSVKVALELSPKENIKVISTGGVLSAKSLSYVGLAERALDSYHVHKAFISGKGAHPQRGISETNELQAALKRKMLSIADETYLLLDSSKFGMQALAQAASWEAIHHVITDAGTGPEWIRQLQENNVSVTVAGD